jgi:hypothetical protein
VSLDVRDQEANAPHRAAMLRLLGAGRITVREVARHLHRSERSVYQVLEGQRPGKWWLPKVIGGLAGADAFAEVSGANDLGIICLEQPGGGLDRPRDIARIALELGGDVGMVQAAIARATSPDSPGGIRIVGSEELELRRALDQLQRAAAAIRECLGEQEASRR